MKIGQHTEGPRGAKEEVEFPATTRHLVWPRSQEEESLRRKEAREMLSGHAADLTHTFQRGSSLTPRATHREFAMRIISGAGGADSCVPRYYLERDVNISGCQRSLSISTLTPDVLSFLKWKVIFLIQVIDPSPAPSSSSP